ncbi:unnamed protein product, partial [Gulo gulo]
RGVAVGPDEGGRQRPAPGPRLILWQLTAEKISRQRLELASGLLLLLGMAQEEPCPPFTMSPPEAWPRCLISHLECTGVHFCKRPSHRGFPPVPHPLLCLTLSQAVMLVVPPWAGNLR